MKIAAAKQTATTIRNLTRIPCRKKKFPKQNPMMKAKNLMKIQNKYRKRAAQAVQQSFYRRIS